MARGMIWNIDNSGTLNLCNPNKKNIKNIIKTIKEVNPDFAVLPEYMTKYYDDLITNGLCKIGFSYFSFNKDFEDRNLRKRVLIASKHEISDNFEAVNISCYDSRNWREIFIKDINIHLLAVDVPLAETSDLYGNKKDNKRNKKGFLDAMLAKAKDYKLKTVPFAMLGDFNLHPNAICSEYLDKFNNELVEITDGKATWNNKKLDYIYVNESLNSKLTYVSTPESTNYSDHSYIFFDYENL